MVVWFVSIGALGLHEVVLNPVILRALSPHWGVDYFARHGWHGLRILGVVVLAITGGEALYADMGHFGARPIRLSWFALAMPALVLSYLGQGALVLRDPRALANPFFSMVPAGPFTYALVVLAAIATTIASQALISGVFSLTHQAVQLGLFPRVTVRHTSSEAAEQGCTSFTSEPAATPPLEAGPVDGAPADGRLDDAPVGLDADAGSFCKHL